jgi:hypothetical protein
MLKKNHVAVAVTLALGAAGVEAATTNTASTVPNVLITGSNVGLGNISLAEGGAGQLSNTSPQDTFYVQLPTGVSFHSGATVTADPSDTTMKLADGTRSNVGVGGAAVAATLTDTDGDSKYDRATWSVNTQSAGSNTILIEHIDVDVASTVAAGDITVTIGSNTPGNPGLTAGTVVNGRAVVAGTTNELTATAPNALIGGNGQSAGTVLITETASGTLATDKTVTITLPSGVTFSSGATVTATSTNMDVANASTSASGTTDQAAISSDNRTATFYVTTASSSGNVGQLSIDLSGKIDLLSTVSAGAINATIGGTASVTAGTVQIATAASGSTTASAVDSASLSSSPAGRSAVSVSNIKIAENFGNVVSDDGNHTITLTLPDGVTFSAIPSFVNRAGTAGSLADPTGYQTSTITIPVSSAASTYVDTYTISNLKVNIGSSVASGSLAVAIAGNTGSGVDAASVNVLNVVDSSVAVAANSTIPTRGIGASGQAIGSFTITESVVSALLANGYTVTATLPSGVTWASAPTATYTGGSTFAMSNTATLSSDKQTATFNVSAASSGTTGATITVSGSVDIASTVSAGDISATVGGTAGASGTVTVATAAQATSISASNLTQLTAGTPTQSVGKLKITEAYSGAISQGKSFRVILPAGMAWSDNSVSVSTATVDGTGTAITNSGWSAASPATTFNTNDTLVITAPSTLSGAASAVTVTLPKVNVQSSASEGTVNATVVDGDTTGANGAGVIGGSLAIAQIGAAATMEASSSTVTINNTGSSTVTISGGTGTYSIATASDTAVATAEISGDTLTITGVAPGTTSVVVTDNAATPQTVTVNITVQQQAVLPDTGTPGSLDGTPTSATISAGATNNSGADQTLTGGSFAATDSVDVTATINVDPNDVGQDGSILIVAGLKQGADAPVMWYMKDSTGAWLPWDGNPGGLLANDGPRALAASESVSVATGLTGLTGDFQVFVGYEVGSNIIYSSTPITFTVQ